MPPGPSAASPNVEAEPSATKRPYIAAPASMFSYMWMIPVVPPVPPYLLVPNIESGVAPAVPPMMPAAHYPPGWDVGVLSNEWTDEDTFVDDVTSSDDGLGAEAASETERRRPHQKNRSRADRLSDRGGEAEEGNNWQTVEPNHFAREPTEVSLRVSLTCPEQLKSALPEKAGPCSGNRTREVRG